MCNQIGRSGCLAKRKATPLLCGDFRLFYRAIQSGNCQGSNASALASIAANHNRWNTMTNLTFSSPMLGIAILVIFVFAGRTWRLNWKEKGEGWKLKCWISGLIATACFAFLAFVPFAPQ